MLQPLSDLDAVLRGDLIADGLLEPILAVGEDETQDNADRYCSQDLPRNHRIERNPTLRGISHKAKHPCGDEHRASTGPCHEERAYTAPDEPALHGTRPRDDSLQCLKHGTSPLCRWQHPRRFSAPPTPSLLCAPSTSSGIGRSYPEALHGCPALARAPRRAR